ncbi:hypothetical protein DUT91_14595 [Phyllobacterium salinisoli]|uniref:Uncharacterized protein n=1 Tax=Phyllobacterium salinisoli TaxID=1899321 RepID=A0A368K543_9HYPH|nr:hypothetical protein [Phyllobacterium salinisoli]RCS23492.1 hypothetical protein DUT91_14595 [Phyllobacterium salinisoli]
MNIEETSVEETKEVPEVFTLNRDDEELKELMALARLLTFAQGTAKNLNANFVEYCLDMALNGILEELQANDKFKLRN